MKKTLISFLFLAIFALSCGVFAACDSGSSSTGGYDFDVVNDSSSSAQ